MSFVLNGLSPKRQKAAEAMPLAALTMTGAAVLAKVAYGLESFRPPQVARVWEAGRGTKTDKPPDFPPLAAQPA
jgi:hypothetical protein